jgi:hypothetical protein
MRFSRRSFVLALALAAAAPHALADPGKEEIKPDNPSEKEVARSIDLSGLVFPVFNDAGKLKNYLFVNARMLVGPGKDPWKYRNQAHFIRDALIRAAHHTSFNVKGDFTKLDEDLAARECLKAANDAVGERDALVAMTFTEIASQVGGPQ